MSLQRHFIHAGSLMYERTKGDAVRLLDHTIDEDCQVFFRLHLALKFLTQKQYLALKKEAEILLMKTGVPDATIVLTASEDCLIARMDADREHRRPKWLIDSMKKQMQLYQRWMVTQPKACVIDTAELDFATLDQIANRIAKWVQTNREVLLQRILKTFIS